MFSSTYKSFILCVPWALPAAQELIILRGNLLELGKHLIFLPPKHMNSVIIDAANERKDGAAKDAIARPNIASTP